MSLLLPPLLDFERRKGGWSGATKKIDNADGLFEVFRGRATKVAESSAVYNNETGWEQQ
jgi:hypothetical protein